MPRLRSFALLAASVMFAASAIAACSSSSSPAASNDGGADAKTGHEGGSKHDGSSPHDGGADVSTSDAKIVGIEIQTTSGNPLQGAPGDGVALEVVFKRSDGTTTPVDSSDVTWTSPMTVTAQNPDDAGPNSILPEAGTEPTAFFVSNPFRISHDGVLFITDPGTTSPATITVSATVADAGSTSAMLKVLAAPTGNAANGGKLFMNVPLHPCEGCHGMTAAGSPPVDAGDGGVEYRLPSGSGGELYAFPAPGLNAATSDAGPNLAADPSWSAGLLGMAAQADMDNNGVALRNPMPTFFLASDGTGKELGAQDFADIYAWLKTQH